MADAAALLAGPNHSKLRPEERLRHPTAYRNRVLRLGSERALACAPTAEELPGGAQAEAGALVDLPMR